MTRKHSNQPDGASSHCCVAMERALLSQLASFGWSEPAVTAGLAGWSLRSGGFRLPTPMYDLHVAYT